MIVDSELDLFPPRSGITLLSLFFGTICELFL